MEIVVNHLTRMRAGYICVAGLDEAGRHVRPVAEFGRLESRLAFEGGGPFSIGALVDLGPVRPRPVPPAIEDHVFDPAVARRTRVEDAERLWTFLEEHASESLVEIFGVKNLVRDGGTASMAAGTGAASLGILRPRGRPAVVQSNGSLRLRVTDPALGTLSLPLTDLRLVDQATHEVDERRVALLSDRLRRRTALLSVGVGRPWAWGGGEPRHWLQVNNVHLDDNPLWPH